MTPNQEKRQRALDWIKAMKRAHEPLVGTIEVYETIIDAINTVIIEVKND